MMNIDEFENEMQNVLKPKRFVHTQGVRYTCAALAMAHGCSLEKAQIAGVLHDCAKCYSDEELLDMADKYGITLTKTEVNAPQLIHSKVGAYLAKEKYGVEDEEIISAISYHTTGKPKMTELEKIVFIADYIEPNRRMLECLPECRQAAFKDLDLGMYVILKHTLNYLKSKCDEQEIDETTRSAYEYYKDLVKGE